MTQVEVAAATDIGRSTLAGIEKGYDQPGRDTLMKLAEFYEVTVDALYAGQSPSSPKVGESVKDTDEAALLSFWRKLDEAGKRLFLLALAKSGGS